MGDSPKWVKSKKRRKKKERRKKERLNNGENNGQATHGARKHAWRTQAAWAKRRKIYSFCVESLSMIFLVTDLAKLKEVLYCLCKLDWMQAWKLNYSQAETNLGKYHFLSKYRSIFITCHEYYNYYISIAQLYWPSSVNIISKFQFNFPHHVQCDQGREVSMFSDQSQRMLGVLSPDWSESYRLKPCTNVFCIAAQETKKEEHRWRVKHAPCNIFVFWPRRLACAMRACVRHA